MNKKNIDQALAALSDALQSQDPESFFNDPKGFIKKIPFRSLSGDHINGGKILNFSSSGIEDNASKTQISVRDDSVEIRKLRIGLLQGDLIVESNTHLENVTAKTIVADVIEAKEIKADIRLERDLPIVFSGAVAGKGFMWAGKGYTKQLVYAENPDRVFSSETIDIAKNKHYSINGKNVLSEEELGSTITKSNLREVGKLKGLIVDGSMVINNYIHFNESTDRLGLGTESPNSALSIAEDGVEIVIGTKDSTKGIIGTYACHDLDIVTDNLSRFTITSGGNIRLGNPNTQPIQTTIHGKLSIKVSTPDPEVDLHVNGAIKYKGKLHTYGKNYPTAGSYNKGDIVWNEDPQMNSPLGWVCLSSGSPGVWAAFARIGN